MFSGSDKGVLLVVGPDGFCGLFLWLASRGNKREFNQVCRSAT